MTTAQFSDIEVGAQISLAGGVFLVIDKEVDGEDCRLIGEYTTPDGNLLPQIFCGQASSEAELI